MSQATLNDQLTGLLTRAAFDEQFKSHLQAAMKTGDPISMAFVDIDHFKPINDAHGHEGGDMLLKAIAGILQEKVSQEVILGRYGGDEFALLFPDMVREQAFLILEGIRAEIEGREAFESINAKVTITGGIASYPLDGNSENEIMRKADQALYHAKKVGRNNIRLAYEEKMAPKTAHFTLTQLERLTNLAQEEGVGEAVLLREALDDLLLKYEKNDFAS